MKLITLKPARPSSMPSITLFTASAEVGIRLFEISSNTLSRRFKKGKSGTISSRNTTKGTKPRMVM